jgi:endonuclease/exonuclease/phosphatase family metal-dependent hydrolase
MSPMRFMLYNMRYGTGGRRCLPWSRYLRRTTETMAGIARFIRRMDPDILGLIEVDAGSYRSRRQNQAESLANELGHRHTYRSKYAERSLARWLPVINKQGNALLTRGAVARHHFHYFDRGMKRLVIEVELDRLTVFLVHLSLTFRARHRQLGDLYSLVKGTAKPHIVAGDFNARWGDREMRLFLAATGLHNANAAGAPTFPSWAPRRQLDFVMLDPRIRLRRFHMPAVTHSDHLPLVVDLELRA